MRDALTFRIDFISKTNRLVCYRGKDFMLEAIDMLKGVSVALFYEVVPFVNCVLFAGAGFRRVSFPVLIALSQSR